MKHISKTTMSAKVRIANSQVKNVAIIGGGASGAIALDSLLQEDHVKTVTLYERRKDLGGIWNLDTKQDRDLSVPNDVVKPGYTEKQIDPQLPNPFNEPEASYKDGGKRKFILRPRNTARRFDETPSYSGMKTNIDRVVMTFSDNKHWFETVPEKDYTYVDRGDVQKYIERYITRNATNDKVSILQGTLVEDVERIEKKNPSEGELPYQFRLTLRQPVNEEFEVWFQETYDAVVVAIGHYFVPYYPDVKGLKEVQERAPQVIHHSKYFRDKNDYKGKHTIVVGSRASGADLSKLLADTNENVYQSIRTDAIVKARTKKQNVQFKPVIQEYQILSKENEPFSFKVIFSDGSEVHNPDYIVYATGYQWSFPFLNRYGQNVIGKEITKEGKIIQNLYQHSFLIDEPLLTFVGVPVDGISFRVFEFQAVLIARYLAGKVALPSKEDQQKWADERLKVKGLTRAYHTLGLDEAVQFLQVITELGRVEEGVKVGREFPVHKKEDIERATKSAQDLFENWDLRT